MRRPLHGVEILFYLLTFLLQLRQGGSGWIRAFGFVLGFARAANSTLIRNTVDGILEHIEGCFESVLLAWTSVEVSLDPAQFIPAEGAEVPMLPT